MKDVIRKSKDAKDEMKRILDKFQIQELHRRSVHTLGFIMLKYLVNIFNPIVPFLIPLILI